MGSCGPIPKPDGERVNRRPRPPLRIVPSRRAPQPELDAEVDWPQQTIDWWQMWGESPLTANFTANDWSELQDTALLHAVVWLSTPGSPAFFKAMGQLRSRTAAFGATPSDRARLPIQFAFADEAEAMAMAEEKRGGQSPASARQRRGAFTGSTSA